MPNCTLRREAYASVLRYDFLTYLLHCGVAWYAWHCVIASSHYHAGLEVEKEVLVWNPSPLLLFLLSRPLLSLQFSTPFPGVLRSLNPARGSGERCKLPTGSGRSPSAKWILVHFQLNLSPLCIIPVWYLSKP